VAAARRWGGCPEDYAAIETFIDSSKEYLGDIRHRALYHHTAGVFLCRRVFGEVITVQRDHGLIEVPVRLIAEEHIKEDLGWIPSPNDYWQDLPIRSWMSGAKMKSQALSTLGLATPKTEGEQ
jgi:hypothetical protein